MSQSNKKQKVVPTFDEFVLKDLVPNLTEEDDSVQDMIAAYNRNQSTVEGILFWRDLAETELQHHMKNVPDDMETVDSLRKEFARLDDNLKRVTSYQVTLMGDLQKIRLDSLAVKAMTDLKGKRYANIVHNIRSFCRDYLNISFKTTPLSTSWCYFLKPLEEEYVLSEDFDAEQWKDVLDDTPPIALQDWVEAGAYLQIVPGNDYDFALENYVYC